MKLNLVIGGDETQGGEILSSLESLQQFMEGLRSFVVRNGKLIDLPSVYTNVNFTSVFTDHSQRIQIRGSTKF
jgi:hypothetical protein